jgi:hypothetical protein
MPGTSTITTVKVTREVRDELAKIGSKGETYNMIIRRLLVGGSKK